MPCTTHSAAKPMEKEKEYVTVFLRETKGTDIIQIIRGMEDTIVQLQYAIEDETTVPVRFQQLFFGSKQIDVTATGNANTTLREIGICTNSPSLVLINDFPDTYLQVELIEFCGKTTCIDMTENSTIKQLQQAVTDKTGIPFCHQRLQFCYKPILKLVGIQDTSKVTLRDVGLSQKNKTVVMHGGFYGGVCSACLSATHNCKSTTCPRYSDLEGYYFVFFSAGWKLFELLISACSFLV